MQDQDQDRIFQSQKQGHEHGINQEPVLCARVFVM